MLLLPFGICLRDRGPRLAQPKSQLAKQTLALSHPQVDLVLPLNPRRQRLSIPQVPTQANLPRHTPQSGVDSPFAASRARLKNRPLVLAARP